MTCFERICILGVKGQQLQQRLLQSNPNERRWLEPEWGRHEGDKKRSDSDHIVKVESTAFADELDIECEGDRNRDVIFPYF